VRPVSDTVARIAAISGLDATLQESLRKKQGEVSRLRETFGHLVSTAGSGSFAAAPARRNSRNG
jgi:hypothetical protein